MALGPRFGHGAGQPSGQPRPRPSARQHWLWRQVRGLRPDRNPLRRRTDRAETYLLAGLLTAAVVVTPVTAEFVSHAAWQGALHVRQQEMASRHKVTAHLLEATGKAFGGYEFAGRVPAYATWTAPAGGPRYALVAAKPDSSKGTAVEIYIDQQGNPVLPPLTVGEAANEADAAGVGAVVGVVLVTLVGAAGIRQAVNRRRMSDWTADWAVTAQTWNRQRW